MRTGVVSLAGPKRTRDVKAAGFGPTCLAPLSGGDTLGDARVVRVRRGDRMAAPRQRAECDWPTASFRRRGATKLLIPGLQAILAALAMAALVTLVASAPSPAV